MEFRKMFEGVKYFVSRRKAKGGTYFEKENIWKREIFREGKGGKYLAKENFLSSRRKTRREIYGEG